MIEPPTTQTIKSSLPRFSVYWLLVCLGYLFLCALLNRWRIGQWSDSKAELSWVPFTILFVVVPTAVFLSCVPRHLEWSSSEFSVRTHWRTYTFPWERLEAFGYSRGLFWIRFAGTSAFHIYPRAFQRPEWQAFEQFLNSHYSDRRAKFWSRLRALVPRA